VVDPFVGSGTTALATLMTGRRFIGGDVDAKAVRLAKARVGRLVADRRASRAG
jgi:DNA modification methylase